MPNPIDYVVENREFREKVVTAMFRFMIIGGGIYSVCLLVAVHYR